MPQVVEIDLPELYPLQYRSIFAPERYSWIEASTKAGKTFGCLVWILAKALEAPYEGANYWWVAPVSKQSTMAFDRLREYLPREIFKANLSEKSIELNGAGKIWFLSADRPNSIFGEDVFAAVIDEASRVKQGAFHAVRSTLTATQGPIRIIGNVKGRSNWFYKGSRAARDRENHAHFKLTAVDAVEAGVFPQEELDDARQTLPDHVFRELYLAEAADDGGNPFGLKAIDSCLISQMPDTDPIAWGWDLAKSVDWTVGIGLDEEGRVCRFHRWQHVPWPETKDKIVRLTDAPALVDSTGGGDPVTEDLQRRSRYFEGFVFSPKSKQQLMEGLAVGIQGQKIRFPDGEIREELDVFEYEYRRNGVRYSAPSGLHDDCVCALALAYRHYDHQRRHTTTTTEVVGSLPSRSSGISRSW